MPFGSVKLIPGVNVERTPTLNEAGYAQSQLIRFKDSLAQKYGGWQKFFPFTVPGAPRDMHAWQDLNELQHLLVATTTNLGVITNGAYSDISPQQLISNFAPDFSTTAGSAEVEIVDPNIENVTSDDSIFFNTPVSVGGIILSGNYKIAEQTGTNAYKIIAQMAATATETHAGTVPVFDTTIDKAGVTITLADNGMAAGDNITLTIPTTGNGVTMVGTYPASLIVTADEFRVTAAQVATATGSFPMNGGEAELRYDIALGPQPLGIGYGLGPYSDGGYSTGVVPPQQTGDPLTAPDWTSDNWGEIALACPQNGAIYYFDPPAGFANASRISTGPDFNGGIFVSTSEQILIAWGSSIVQRIGVEQDPMLVQWCDSGNFFEWTVNGETQAGNFRIPIGSEIRGGAAVSSQNLIWTDLDLWSMNYIGQPFVFGFNKIGAGAGLAGSHAMLQLRDKVMWMGPSNFYVFTGGGVAVIPCPVWDAVFQNLNTAFIKNVRAMPNTPFNEAGWAYPSLASVNGECDSYVKFNILEPGAPWDYGLLPRSAWIDQSVLGAPIGGAPSGAIYQHETGNDADGQPLVASFTTGYFELADGEDFVFVDQILPDFKWGTYAGAPSAQIQMTFNVVNFPGDTPVSYGPYTVTQATTFISVRFRGRQMSITVQSSDPGSFWRLGRVRYRFAPLGRR
jgi:hypothetical protein